MLSRETYAHDADVVAKRLLGCLLEVHGADDSGTDRAPLRARIVETEAYLGEADLACHASRGRTRRTESLYGPPGTAYVYLIYGVHRLFNVVASSEGDPHAVLVRAVEPLNFEARTHGPGLLSKALGIDLDDDRSDLTTGRIRIAWGAAPARVAVGPRIGVDYAGAWAGAPLRFGDADSDRLSRPFPGRDPTR
ncbi:MAG: DNA-3-methyladenine glycosylase [Trueperaceae bacterium]|nr:DNA-3-methyladenine glycosylase [Trueperaceae bacterium]